MFAPFLVLGLDRALYYFIPQEKENSRKLVVENLLLLTVTGTIFFLFLVLGGNELLAKRFSNPLLETTLLILAPYFLVMIPAQSMGACLIAVNRTVLVAIYNPISRLIVLAAVLCPVYFSTTVVTATKGFVYGTIATGVMAIYLMFHNCKGSYWPDFSGMKKQVLYSFPLGIAAIMGTFAITLDKAIVSVLTTPKIFSVYINGAMELPLMPIITSSITSILVVDFAQLHAEGRNQEIVVLIRRAMSKTALILLPAMFFLLCVAPEFMTVLYGSEYRASATPFRIYLLLLPLRTFVYGSVYMATGNNRLVLSLAAILLVGNAVCSWFAVLWMGPNGAAVATVFVTYAAAVPHVWYYYPKILGANLSEIIPARQFAMISLVCLVSVVPIWIIKWSCVNCSAAVVFAMSSLIFSAILLSIFHKSKLINMSAITAQFKSLF